MEQVGDMKLYTLEECLDKRFGPVGTPERDELEAEVNADLQAYFVGNAVKKARLEQKLTQEQLGNKVGVTKSLISKLECGRGVTISVVGKVFRALGVPTASLDMGEYGKLTLW
ncbi:MAG: helix-turn-helix domain-containing protein [Prevotellaceae bacterium]|nr:helix-turn-helix domain-containing protein [Prevotellaceae bacterium]